MKLAVTSNLEVGYGDKVSSAVTASLRGRNVPSGKVSKAINELGRGHLE
mgnify:FL=1